ncbi:hypothetical protein RIF29_39754 [Crotalaria pallida]|uniref:Exocyst complex component Sec10-like alpha-helical bundle domain-containing protein n=1 Tax=Crotalaria pallida TaxID=3830 RepID=A0AAN9E2D5_CROPI
MHHTTPHHTTPSHAATTTRPHCTSNIGFFAFLRSLFGFFTLPPPRRAIVLFSLRSLLSPSSSFYPKTQSLSRFKGRIQPLKLIRRSSTLFSSSRYHRASLFFILSFKGNRLHKVLLNHWQKFTFNPSGGLRLKHDIPEYGEFVLLLLMRNLNCWAWHLKFWKKNPIGIEFAKHFKAHLGPIEGLAVSGDGLLFTTISDDSSVHIYDARGCKNDPIISKEIHLGPIKVMKYNLVYDSVISADIESALPTLAKPIMSFDLNEDAIVGSLKQSLVMLVFSVLLVVI